MGCDTRPPSELADQSRGGLLTDLLMGQRPTPATSDGQHAADEPPDQVAPLLASAATAVLTPRVVVGLGKIGILGPA